MTSTDDSPWLDTDQQRVWRQWLDVTARLPLALGRQLQKDSGLSLQDFAVLASLSEAADEELRVAALADVLQWERSRLSHHLGRMERRGLIKRRECPEDGRGALVALEPLGRRKTQEAAPGHARFVRRLLFGGLDPEGLRALDDLTRGVLARLADSEPTGR